MRRVCRTEVGNGKVGALYRLSYTNHAIVRGAVTRNSRGPHPPPDARRTHSLDSGGGAATRRHAPRVARAGARAGWAPGPVVILYMERWRCRTIYDAHPCMIRARESSRIPATRPGPARAFPRFRGARRRSTTTGNGELAKRLYGNIGNARACVSNRIESNTVPRLLVVALVVS